MEGTDLQVFLVQHAEAKPKAEDPARPLTDRGREEARRVAQRAAILGLHVPEIHHSSALRARQTAEILAEHLRPPRGIREVEGLAPTDDPESTKAEIASAREPLMLVGHLPHLSRLVSALLVGDPGQLLVRFRMGAIVCVGQIEDRWLLQWILTPEIAGSNDQ